MNAQDLKNSILQLAVEGKLVPQDSNDEPAYVMLEKIKKEKERLIKAKKIKRNTKESSIYKEDGHYYEKIGKKGEPICIDEDLPFDIPDSWEWGTLGNILTVNGGKRVPKGYKLLDEPTSHIYIRVTNMKNGTIEKKNLKYIDDKIYEQIKQYTIGKDDLYITVAGTIGKVGVVPEYFDGMNLTENANKLTNIFIDKNFLLYILTSDFVQTQLNVKTTKVAQPKLAIKRILSTMIPIPPLNEQKRIVDKIEEVLPLIDEYGVNKEQLDKINSELPTKLKSSILQEAIQAKLVPQDPNDEPASVLLEKIQQEKERLIKAKKIKRNTKESSIYKEDGHYYEKIGKKGEPICIDEDLPFDIPDSWEWCKLENITSNVHYGYTASAKDKGNAKLLRITDIHENFVNWDSVPFCDVDSNKLPNYILKDRDIVMARTGGTIGKSYIINQLNDIAVFASYLIRIIPLENVNEQYLKMFFECPLFWSQLKDNTKGTGQPNVNAKSLKNLFIPLPPLNEQERIADKVEVLFENVEFLINK